MMVSSQVRIQPVLGGLRAGALQAAELALDGGAHLGRDVAVGQARRGRPRPGPRRRPRRPAPRRMAASCWRSRNSRWLLLHALGHVGADRSASSASASASLTQAVTFSRRSSTSVVSSSSTLRSMDRSGHHPAVSARAPGASTSRSMALMRRPPSRSSSRPAAARYSRASSSVRSVGVGVVHQLGLDPQGVARRRPRRHPPGPGARPGSTRAGGAVGQRAAVLDAGHGAHPGVAAVDAGHQQQAARRSRPRRPRPGLVGLEGDGDHHLGQHDALGSGAAPVGSGWSSQPCGAPERRLVPALQRQLQDYRR